MTCSFSLPIPRSPDKLKLGLGMTHRLKTTLATTAVILIACLNSHSAALAKLTVTPSRGFFYKPVKVEISATAGTTIVYTLNGDEPSLTNGTSLDPAKTTLNVTNTTILRVAVFKDGRRASETETHSYIFPAEVARQQRPAAATPRWQEDPPDGDGRSYPADFKVDTNVVEKALPGYSFTNALMSLPSVSVVTPMDGLFGQNGIYTRVMLKGLEWERRTSVELLFPDGRPGFHVEAGLRMHGAVSRLNHVTPKHPFRLIFREKYGTAKLDFPLFPGSPVKKFDHLILRACSTDAWPMANTVPFLWNNRDATYQRDQWMRDTQLAMGHPSPHGRYVHLYLNGLYWGVYNLTERPNESFAAAYGGGKKSEYDVLGEFNGQLRAGNRQAWDQLLKLADRVPREPAVYWQIVGKNENGSRNPNLPVLLDLDNLIDYMALHIYAPAVDWPNRNWWAARRRTPDTAGFRFFVWDQEVAADRLDREITWATNRKFAEVNDRGTPAHIYDRLRTHPEFKRRFAERLKAHLSPGGALSVEACQKRWAARAAEMDKAIVAESARWGDTYRKPAYTREADWLRMSNFTQNVYWPSNYPKAVVRFRSVGLVDSQKETSR